jgi:integrase
MLNYRLWPFAPGTIRPLPTKTARTPSGRIQGSAVIARAWLDQRRYKPTRTYAQYESRVENHIIDSLGRMAVGKITPVVVATWIDGLRSAGLSETTIGLILSHLSGIFEYAVEDDIIDRNPCRARSVREAKPKRSRKTGTLVPITAEQSDAIRTQLPERYRATVDVARGLGLRQGEIFALSPDDIDRKQRTVHVERQISHDHGRMVFAPPKCSDSSGIRDRWIPVADEILFRLVAHMSEHPPATVTLPWNVQHGRSHAATLLFTTSENAALSKQYFNEVWKAALEAADIVPAINAKPAGRGRLWEPCRDKMMHVLPHLYASERIAEGMDISTLAERLGHSDPAYTLRNYIHQVSEDHEEERRLIDRTLRGTTVPRSPADVGWM